ncbi:MAG: tetratricopeptide repeat protein [Rubellimicrobium sp.]|nr:tetratricopeptide repeat protein [Rubellimicrobium sp.]
MRQRAIAAHRAGRRDEARALYAARLARAPQDAGIWTNLGVLLREAGEHDLALAAQERAFALDPDNPATLNNLANILGDIGDNTRALALRRRLIARDPDNPAHRAMEGKALRALGQHDAAIRALDAALARHPGDAELRIQRALTHLAAGNHAQGLTDYAARWQTGELTPRRMAVPKWDGGPLDGRRILVLPEQGLGDALAFARFLPVLGRFRPGHVRMQAPRPLARLLEGVAGADTGGDHDTWTDLMDLPALHFAASDTIPPPVRVTIPEDSRARARAITAPFRDRFRIGVVWGGSPTYRGDAFRSFSHRHFHRLLDLPGVQMFSLYKGPGLKAFHADGTSAFITDAASSDRDLADTAALIEELDLVITSCTVTAHLAGTLGRPVWVLLHRDPFWMWGHAGAATPWYPSMRLIRQDCPRDWDGVFARVREGVAALLRERAG